MFSAGTDRPRRPICEWPKFDDVLELFDLAELRVLEDVVLLMMSFSNGRRPNLKESIVVGGGETSLSISDFLLASKK